MQHKTLLGIAAAFFCLLGQAHAGPADYIAMPAVEYGEREIDFKFGTASKGGQDRFSASSIGFGYGVSERWFTEIYLKAEKTGGENAAYEAWEWENRFQLTETGQYPVDVGFLTEIEKPRNSAEGYEVRWGPLLQTEFGRMQYNLNVLFGRNYRSAEASQTEMFYQFQAKYRWQPQIEFGVQAFGDLGKWDHWNSRPEQNHRVGPAIFGKIPLGGRQVIKYNAAFLFGTTDAAADHTFRLQTEYEF